MGGGPESCPGKIGKIEKMVEKLENSKSGISSAKKGVKIRKLEKSCSYRVSTGGMGRDREKGLKLEK